MEHLPIWFLNVCSGILWGTIASLIKTHWVLQILFMTAGAVLSADLFSYLPR